MMPFLELKMPFLVKELFDLWYRKAPCVVYAHFARWYEKVRCPPRYKEKMEWCCSLFGIGKSVLWYGAWIFL